MPPHMKKTINQAHLENGTNEQIVPHLERELELNGLEAPDELQIITVSHKTANTNAGRPKQTCHYCKKPGHYRNQCRLLKREKQQSKDTQNIPGNKNTGAKNSFPNNNTNKSNNNNYKNSNRAEGKPKKLFFHPVRHVGRQTTPKRSATMEPMQPIERVAGIKDRKDKIRSKKEPTKMIQMKLLRLQPKI